MDLVFASDAGIVFGGQDEFAFLQNPDGADVVLGYEGVEWPFFDFGDECLRAAVATPRPQNSRPIQ